MSDESLFSTDWYRVRDLKPWMASDVTAYRHVYRGRPCYVLQRRASGKYFRVNTATYQLIQAFNGRSTVNEIWQRGIARHDTLAATQNEFLALLTELHDAEVISVGRSLDTETLFGNRKRSSNREYIQRYSNPLYIRFRLFDPDSILSAIAPAFGWIFKREIVCLWSLFVFCSVIALAPDIHDLINQFDRISLTSPKNVLTALVLWPLLKLLHEFAHGIAVKHYGGEVREMGLAFLVLLPIPYVDASASAVFTNKWRRITVSAAGIMMDLSIATIALLVWSVSNGALNEVAAIVVLMSGVSTIVFNGNPLLKFDGYYVLADYLEIPNLAERSARYARGIVKQLFFGVPNSVQAVDSREACWLEIYAICSSAFRFFLILFIAWALSARFYIFGILLALYALITVIGIPIVRSMYRLWRDPEISRIKIASVVSVLPIVGSLFLFLVPVPAVQTVQGVVWLPENSIVRVENNCEVTGTPVASGSTVKTGDVLFTCANSALATDAQILTAERDEIKAKQSGLLTTNTAKYQSLERELDANEKRLHHAKERQQELSVKARSDGQFVVDGEYILQGKWLSAGRLAGYIVPHSDDRTVRVALSEATVGAKLRWQSVNIRAPQADGKLVSHRTYVSHQTAAATLSVASAALTEIGGGDLQAAYVGQRIQLESPAYDIELAWPASAAALPVGSRVWVRLAEGTEPLGKQWLRRIQRTFLGRVRA